MTDVALPASLGPYRVLGIVGRGGMGVVYRAVHEKLHREVAIKSLPGELLRDAELRERFAAEARAQAQLHHPHIVAVHDLLEVDGAPYLVMELFGTKSLQDLLDERQGQGLPEGEALRLIGQVLGALDAAHARGIIHRDIKPGNVLVSDDGVAKLSDFGIALLIGETRRTRTAQMLGTCVYMSPEQIVRPGALDHRTDVYSAGVLLFELLAGRPPFLAANDFEVWRLHLETSADPQIAVLANVRPAVRAALAKALRKDPAERFSSAAAFHRALLADVPIAPPPVRDRRVARRIPRRYLRALATVLLAAATAVAGWWARQRRDSPPLPPPPVQVIQIRSVVAPPLPIPTPSPLPIESPAAPPRPERPSPTPRRPPAPSPPPAVDPEPAIRRRTVTQLRAALAQGTVEIERLLAAADLGAGDLEAAHKRTSDLLKLSSRYRQDLVDEVAALELLGARITESTIERHACERRLAEIEWLIAESSFPEAKRLAKRLAEEPGTPTDVARRARELMAVAEAELQKVWKDAPSTTDATVVNPRRKGKPDDDDPNRRKGAFP